ncbi:MAG: ATP-dependent zinc metalloprotease FtsH [Bacteroidales bacterium]|nr:ATP-dependent zinc metalloprotease FtsH [Porphyromonas sp.]MDD6934374.1 ATP-dependent zinc metalloprotease FtsH [Bacteroidales bacterium]MDY3101957.1 ATP-dependent zinc metalloprotease FtsH [Porphyromonas sp.]
MAKYPNGSTPSGGNKRKMGFNPLWIYLLVALSLLGIFFMRSSDTGNKELSWNEFQRIAQEEVFESITVHRDGNKAEAVVKEDRLSRVFTKQELRSMQQPNFSMLSSRTKYVVITHIPSVDKFADYCERVDLKTEVTYVNKGFSLSYFLINWLPMILIIVFWIYIMRRMNGGGKNAPGGGIFSVGKAKAQLYDKTNIDVTFKDVAGLHEAKQEIEEIVHFLKDPSKYTALGGKIPKGALLVGPPGTGKTLLAKAVAGEAHVPFFSMSGSDFVEMFVGVGASRVRDLFAQAKSKAPCIVFIDEIDAVGRARGRNTNMGGNDERESTLNQLLTEMDGFGSNSGVIVLAATNRVDVLDSALLRAGRFDRQIAVDLPDINDRKEIFAVHMRSLRLADNCDIEQLARQTPGFSGADIANVCNEAALIAARNEKSVITRDDFMNAVDRIIGGLEKKNRIVTEEERKSIAIHEAGHATISWHLQYGNPLVKVTIVPRGKALGAAWYMPEERQITHTQVLLDELCSLLGGRAAEELFLNRISTGAANDLERVTKIAYAMVVYYGMSDKLPNVNYHEQGGDYSFQKPYSDETAQIIDQEVARIIAEQYERAKALLLERREGHHALYELLLEREVIYTEDVESIFGKRPWISRTDELLLSEHNEATTNQEEDQENVRGEKGSEATPPPFNA